MSLMIPRRTIDSMRQYVDISLSAYGIDCSLYIPTTASYNTAEKKDIYATPSDYIYNEYTSKVFIEWNPTTYRLKKLGVYVEDSLPLIVWFGNTATVVSAEGQTVGAEVDVDIVKGSYFTIDIEYIPDSIEDTSQFEILQPIIRGMHDAVIVKGFSAVPRRVAA